MQPVDISIIYQDHHLLIINKPARIVIHPTYKHAGGTLWNALLAHLEEQGGDDWQPPDLPDEATWAGAPEHVKVMLREKRTERLQQEEGLLPRPCLLHRLDKDTSGILALARTARARRHLIRQFETRTITKRYLAMVQRGAPAWACPRTTFTIKQQDESLVQPGETSIGADLSYTLPMMQFSTQVQPCHPERSEGSGHRAREILSAAKDDKAGPGMVVNVHDQPPTLPRDTTFILDGSLQRDPDDRRRCIVGPDGQRAITTVRVLARDDDFALLEVQPITGRTHQIRAHLAAAGYGIVGDQVYAPEPVPGSPQAALTRQFLHAYSLELRRYPDNALCRFVAPLPDDLCLWMQHYFPASRNISLPAGGNYFTIKA